jgi:hypothetical protein
MSVATIIYRLGSKLLNLIVANYFSSFGNVRVETGG